jgi:hypothetical protein
MKKTIFVGLSALLVSAAVNAQVDTTQKKDTTTAKDTSSKRDSSQAMLHVNQNAAQQATVTAHFSEFTKADLPEAIRVKAIAQKQPFVEPKEA